MSEGKRVLWVVEVLLDDGWTLADFHLKKKVAEERTDIRFPEYKTRVVKYTPGEEMK